MKLHITHASDMDVQKNCSYEFVDSARW